MDYYRTLQVSRHAEPEVIERAYRALSLKYHPDRVQAQDRAAATRRMQAINAAYDVLHDPAARSRYDAQLPSEGAQAWDEFWSRGLLGLFLDRYGNPLRSRP